MPLETTSTPADAIRAIENTTRASALEMADAIVRTMDIAFSEIAQLRAEIDELRQSPQRQNWKNRQEAAAYLCCSVSKIDELAASGRLQKHLFDSKPLYAVSDLDALLMPVVIPNEDAA